jgi:hypothetical protein
MLSGSRIRWILPIYLFDGAKGREWRDGSPTLPGGLDRDFRDASGRQRILACRW